MKSLLVVLVLVAAVSGVGSCALLLKGGERRALAALIGGWIAFVAIIVAAVVAYLMAH